jgi:hypothetical protein
MRRIVLLSAMFICGLLTAAEAAPASIAGSWAGSGTFAYRGSVDRVYCRARFTKTSAKSFAVSSACRTANSRYDISGNVTDTGGGRLPRYRDVGQCQRQGHAVLWRQTYVGERVEPAGLRADHARPELDFTVSPPPE